MLDQASPLKSTPSPAAPSGKFAPIHILLTALFAVVVLISIREGLALRRWTYAATVPFRFHFDINNAWTQGTGVVERARRLDPKAGRVSFHNLMRSYLNRYDAAIEQHPDGDYQLDYPPARLLIMSIWVWHETDEGRPQLPVITLFGLRIGPGKPLGDPADFAGPLLEINTAFELLAMAGAFMLGRAVLRRANVRWADFLALGPALLLWFNPALLIDAHAWPQWDAWPLPFWLWAGYFAVTRRWLAAGLCLGLGTMFKGQIFMTMSFFVLWPLFQLRLRAVLEVAAGMLLGMMLFVCPWMLQTSAAKAEFAIVLLFTLAVLPWIKRDWRMLVLCASAGVSLLLTGLFLGGSFAWWHVGFEYGADRYTALTMGPTPNLAAGLQDLGWGLSNVVCSFDGSHPAIHADITLRQALIGAYVVALVLCSIAAAIQDSRGDRRLLLAMATPWLVMFAFLPQMHERYLIWGAVFTGLAACVSAGSTLLHLVVTFIACIPMLPEMLGSSGHTQDYPKWVNFLDHFCNDSAALTVLLAMIFVYLSFVASDGRRRPVTAQSPSSNVGWIKWLFRA
jgi:hypothetical protein